MLAFLFDSQVVIHSIALDFPYNCEAQFPQNEVGLPRCFTAAEFFRLKHSFDGIAAGQTDDGFGSVPLVVVDQFLTALLARS